MAISVATIPAGKRFYRGGKLPSRGVVWLTDSLVTATSFSASELRDGDIYFVGRYRTTRRLKMLRITGTYAGPELAELLGVRFNENDLRRAAHVFCTRYAKRHGLDGWHMPSFYCRRCGSDTLVCNVKNVELVREVEVW